MYKIIQPFVDAYDRKAYGVNDEFTPTYDVKAERYEQLVRLGYLKKLKTKKKEQVNE